MNDLVRRFDAVVADQWEPYARPTAQSIATIESHFGFVLPQSLISFAKFSKSYSSFFLSIGPDLDNHSHILSKNRLIRTDDYWLALNAGKPAPASLVLITENFMANAFWCLDIAENGPEYPVVQWTPGVQAPKPMRYQDLECFVEEMITWYRRDSRR
jgi:hypothetical protein